MRTKNRSWDYPHLCTNLFEGIDQDWAYWWDS